MAFLEAILFPIVWVFRHVLEFLHSANDSYGLAIIGLSLFVAIISYPLTIYGRNIELKHKAIHDAMAPEIADIKSRLTGEERFNAIDAVYQNHRYHPIKSISTISGFAIQLPFLLSSLVLLVDYPPLVESSFFVIPDLSKPDNIIRIGAYAINILPILMSVITIIEAMIKPEMDTVSRRRFLFVSIGMFIIVYALPSAVVLYWATSNFWSLLRTLGRLKV